MREFDGRFALWALVAWMLITLAWWALAFAPLPVPDEWLAQARAVCFGAQPNGLPDTWGWGALIVSPLAVLGILLGVWGADLKFALGRLAEGRVGRVALIVMATAPLLGVLWVGQRVAQARSLTSAVETSSLPATLPAGYPQGVEPAPPLGLVDQKGELVTLESLRGRPVLVTFAFAHCKTICPVVVNTVYEAARELPPGEASVVVVSLDPWRDTPSSLPQLSEAWRLDKLPDAHVLSGEVDQVLAVLDAWNMPIQRDEKTGDIIHPGLISVLGPDGTRAYSFNSPPTAWVVEAAKRVS